MILCYTSLFYFESNVIFNGIKLYVYVWKSCNSSGSTFIHTGILTFNNIFWMNFLAFIEDRSAFLIYEQKLVVIKSQLSQKKIRNIQ